MGQALKKQDRKYLQTISPVDGSIYVERELHGEMDIEKALVAAQKAQASWAKTPLSTRQDVLNKAVDILVSQSAAIAEEITWQMGRPLSQAAGEIRGLEERARHMIEIAPQALADIAAEKQQGFTRYIKRVPLGVVAIIAPWNYPYLTSVNGIIPALLAGNSVVLKHSHQTPLVAERYQAAFDEAGLPNGLFQYLHLDHGLTETLIADKRICFVNFTGSVKGGHAVQKAISDKFIAAGLELGGKDAAYVRADADVDSAVETLVDGAFFNSGQSCCGIERIYVDESLYEGFIEKFAALTRQYKLGNPLEDDTNIGPMVRIDSAMFIRTEIEKAIKSGATALINESDFPASKKDSAYIAPQVLVDVNHSMDIMREENFGPIVGIMKVNSDEKAIELINDSEYGLTASIWTKDYEIGVDLADQIDTGTVFINRCDYLDPALAWTGVKNSGRGCTLSALGFESLTRPKSYHIKEI